LKTITFKEENKKMSNQNKKLRTLTLPSVAGENVTYDLCPDWENIENKPDSFGVGEFYEVDGAVKGEVFNDYDNNIASGANSHAEGTNTTAASDYSHAEGIGNVIPSSAPAGAHAQGSYSKIESTDSYLHVVGNGTGDDARSNAHTLDT
jgi:hypothetical protein